jgi:hypothetical protein
VVGNQRTKCRSPSEVPTILTCYIIDRLRGREPIDWRERFRMKREELLAKLEADKNTRDKGDTQTRGQHTTWPIMLATRPTA